MNKRTFLGLLGGSAAGTLGFGKPLALAQDMPAIRVASLVSDTAGEPVYGQDSGIFTRAGFHVELTLFNNYGPVQAAVASRAVDVGVLDFMGLPSPLRTISRSRSLRPEHSTTRRRRH
jgi:ABC-type nitrate/sulfonate/bicarbonate transport system substrate-binding protein